MFCVDFVDTGLFMFVVITVDCVLFRFSLLYVWYVWLRVFGLCLIWYYNSVGYLLLFDIWFCRVFWCLFGFLCLRLVF